MGDALPLILKEARARSRLRHKRPVLEHLEILLAPPMRGKGRSRQGAHKESVLRLGAGVHLLGQREREAGEPRRIVAIGPTTVHTDGVLPRHSEDPFTSPQIPCGNQPTAARPGDSDFAGAVLHKRIHLAARQRNGWRGAAPQGEQRKAAANGRQHKGRARKRNLQRRSRGSKQGRVARGEIARLRRSADLRKKALHFIPTINLNPGQYDWSSSPVETSQMGATRSGRQGMRGSARAYATTTMYKYPAYFRSKCYRRPLVLEHGEKWRMHA